MIDEVLHDRDLSGDLRAVQRRGAGLADIAERVRWHVIDVDKAGVPTEKLLSSSILLRVMVNSIGRDFITW